MATEGVATGAHAVTVSPAGVGDFAAIWELFSPEVRSGKTYAVPTNWTAQQARGMWFGPNVTSFIGRLGEEVAGACFVRPNTGGPGSGTANAGFVTAPAFRGHGVARALCERAMAHAREAGFRGMVFNHVVSTNVAAVALWKSLGFRIVGTIPKAFDHPEDGPVALHVMHRALEP